MAVAVDTVIATVPPPAVSTELISALHRDGFAVIERVTTPEDLDRITRIMARLYRRYRSLARERYAWDLGVADVGESPEILEINQTIDLEPELRETLTFSRCRALAEILLDRPVEYRFDHAIYKPAFNGRATAWHQDEAYTLDPTLVTTHFWVPVQDVSVEMGCMQFIPGSHRERIRPHRPAGAPATRARPRDPRRGRQPCGRLPVAGGRRDRPLPADAALHRCKSHHGAAAGVVAGVRATAAPAVPAGGQGPPRVACGRAGQPNEALSNRIDSLRGL